MSLLKNLFGWGKARTIRIDGLGEFSYFNDGQSEYWKIERSIGELPSTFDFGAIIGNIEGPNPEALEAFRLYATNPEKLHSYLNDLFFSKIREKFGDLSVKDIQADFYLKSLTCTSEEEFEFGLHSNKVDIFVESFCRGGVVSEVYLDEGCCDYV